MTEQKTPNNMDVYFLPKNKKRQRDSYLYVILYITLIRMG